MCIRDRVMTERIHTELLSGRDVVATGRYPYTGRLGILSQQDWKKVDEAIALVHAGEVQQQDFRRISDGQRQRLMLAQMCIRDRYRRAVCCCKRSMGQADRCTESTCFR